MVNRREALKIMAGIGASVAAEMAAGQLVKPVKAATKVLESMVPEAPASVEMPIPLQRQRYELSCESAVAGQVLAALTGDLVDTWEDKVILSLLKTDSPTTGFWGDINGHPTIYDIDKGDNQPITPPINSHQGAGYGVHWEPIAAAMNRVGGEHVTAQAATLTYDSLAEQLKSGNPVLLWVINSRQRVGRVLDDGTQVWLFEHCVVARGVRQAADGTYEYLINDPWWVKPDDWQNQNSSYMVSWAKNFGGGSVIATPKHGLPEAMPVKQELPSFPITSGENIIPPWSQSPVPNAEPVVYMSKVNHQKE